MTLFVWKRKQMAVYGIRQINYADLTLPVQYN